MNFDLHVLKNSPSEGHDVDVGPSSALAMNVDTGDLFEDIMTYDDGLDDVLKEGVHPIVSILDDIGARLIAGDRVNLICPCQPKGWYRTCHGQMIKNQLRDALRRYHGLPVMAFYPPTTTNPGRIT